MNDADQRPLMNGVTGPDKTTATERKRRPMSDEETNDHRAETYKKQADKWRGLAEKLEAKNKILRQGLDKIDEIEFRDDEDPCYEIGKIIKETLAKARPREGGSE